MRTKTEVLTFLCSAMFVSAAFAANKHNEPGKFNTLIAFGLPDGYPQAGQVTERF